MDPSPSGSHDAQPAGFPASPAHSIDDLLAELRAGDPEALEKLFGALYRDLHQRASKAMAHQGPQHTLQPTALVNEAYLRILRGGGGEYADRSHFLLAASKAMRHVLVDHYRAKIAGTRPQGRVDIDLGRIVDEFDDSAGDLDALDQALEALAERDPAMARLVELRFFGGVSMSEIAEILDIPQRTLERRWKTLRAWLYTRLK